jgi:hypothetical protein
LPPFLIFLGLKNKENPFLIFLGLKNKDPALIFLFLGLKNKEKSLCVAEAFGQKAQLLCKQ